MSTPLRVEHSETPNQGSFLKTPVTWKGLRFANNAEVEIAKALDVAAVAYQPNCAMRVGEKGLRQTRYPDFLVIWQGKVGILEVDEGGHMGRAAEDHARDRLFRRSTGIHVIERYCREQAEGDPHGVVREFLDILARS